MNGPTAGYQAGPEANDVVVSYAQEATYGVPPATQFQALRMTGETLAGTKTRTRPGEILTTGEVAAATTTQESATGNINFALSFGTYDDLLAGSLQGDWGPTIAISGAGGDIAFAGGAAGTTRTITSGSGKFSGIAIGQWIRLAGFSANPLLNTAVRVTANTGSVLSFVLGFASTDETPGGASVQIRGSMLINGARMFKSFTVQKKLAAGRFLRYPGSFVSDFQLSGGVGSFLSGNFMLMAKQETSATVDASAGAVLPAPAGRVHDPVAGFGGVYLDGLPLPGTVDSFQISLTATGAKQEYGMGDSAAAGQIMGLLEAKGTLKTYLRDLVLYERYKAETQGVVSFYTRDPAGNAYVISLLAATIMNPGIQATGPSTAVMASFSLEGNPQYGGGTIQIDRLPAV